MKVLIVGANGYIGSRVAVKLKADGHTVIGLARSEQTAQKLTQQGYQVERGDLNDPASLVRAAQGADAVIQVAQTPYDPQGDFLAHMTEYGQTLLAAVNALIEALRGTNRPLIFTGGTAEYGDSGDGIFTEDTPTLRPPYLTAFLEAEQRVLQATDVPGMSIRPPVVYGHGGGPVAGLIQTARASGQTPMSGSGDNLLSFVHVDDLAELYALLLENPQSGLIVNAVTEPFVSQKQVLESVHRLLGLAGNVEPEPEGSAGGYSFFSGNSRVSGARARALGWNPHQPTVTEEIERGSYRRE